MFRNSSFSRRNVTALLFMALAAFGFSALAAGPVAANDRLTGAYVFKAGSVQTNFAVRVMNGTRIGGTFETVSGRIILDARRPERSKVLVSVDLGSVKTENPRLTEFLKSSAMFHVDSHPRAEFASTRIRQVSPYEAEVEGVLKLRGLSQRTKMHVKLKPGRYGKRIGFEANGDFFRSLYGMTVGQPIYGNKVTLRITGTGRRN